MQGYTLQQLADEAGLTLAPGTATDVCPDQWITGLGTLESAIAGQVSFLANANYQKYLAATSASAVLIRPEMAEFCPVTCLITDNPYVAFARLSQLFDPQKEIEPEIHPGASIHDTAVLGADVAIGPGAVIEAGVVLGDRCVIGANSVIGKDSSLGNDCHIFPNVTIYHGVSLGQQVRIHSNTVIGADGFGFANEKGKWVRIAQLGGVIIGDFVEIGSNTNIDRGALDDTVIGSQVIIDSQVQIAHNVRIGNGCAIAGCTGIAGSARIGNYCMIAGAANIAGHISICDGVTVTMCTSVTKDITEPGTYSSGTLMMPSRHWRRNVIRFSQLDQLAKKVRLLEKEAGLKNISE